MRILDHDFDERLGRLGVEPVCLDREHDLWGWDGVGLPPILDAHVIDLSLSTEEERLLQELARISFLEFVRYWFIKRKLRLVESWYLHYLCEVVEAIVRGDADFRNVLVNLPPRFLKSEIFCVAMPAWALGVDYTPMSSVLSASYSARLAGRDSRRTLELVRSTWYRATFPWVTLHRTKQGADEWWVIDRKTGVDVASRYSAGTGGTLTGMGGNLLIADDLLKPEDANSDLVRGKANEWIGETWWSRANEPDRARRVFVAQRLNEEDTSGYLLKIAKTPGFERITHICMPNECERRTVYSIGEFFYERPVGELLCAERLSKAASAALKVIQGRNYDGQYQQRPTKQEGGMLKPKRLEELDGSGEEIMRRLGIIPNEYIDFAATEVSEESPDPDESAIAIMGRDELGRIIILDMWAEPVDNAALARQHLALCRKWKPMRRKGEKGGLKNAFASALTLVSQQQKYWQPVEGIYVSGNKMVKAMPLEAVLNAGQLCVPKHAPWLTKFQQQLRQFPNGTLKDMVDAAAYGCHDLQDMQPGETPPQHDKLSQQQIDDQVMASYRDRINAARERKLAIQRGEDPDDRDD